MDEYDDLAARKELSVEMLKILLEVSIVGRKTLLAILDQRGSDLSRMDILRLLRMAPEGCGTALEKASELLMNSR